MIQLYIGTEVSTSSARNRPKYRETRSEESLVELVYLREMEFSRVDEG